MARILSLLQSQTLVSLTGVRRAAVCRMSLEARARELFATAVEAVQPDAVVRRGVERKDDSLVIDGRTFALRNNLHLVGFGKAVLGMAAEAERIAGDHLVKGVISVPHGIQETLRCHGKRYAEALRRYFADGTAVRQYHTVHKVTTQTEYQM